MVKATIPLVLVKLDPKSKFFWLQLCIPVVRVFYALPGNSRAVKNLDPGVLKPALSLTSCVTLPVIELLQTSASGWDVKSIFYLVE